MLHAVACLAMDTQQQVLLFYWSCSHTVSEDNPLGLMLLFMGDHLYYYCTQERTSRKGHMGSGLLMLYKIQTVSQVLGKVQQKIQTNYYTL